MYERFFGLRQRPFDLVADPRFLYLSSDHREALSTLQYGISGRKGITLLLGEAGTGKTTIVRAALGRYRTPHTRIVYLSNPILTRSEFFEYLTAAFELDPSAATSKTQLLLELTRSLTARYEAGHVSALIVDEAQALPLELLEEVRLLANIEAATERLLPVVLAGQRELAQRLNERSLRQLKQRVGLRCALEPLTLRETGAYVATRVRVAGGDVRRLFTPRALARVHEWSGGIPRVISVMCDNALVSAYALGRGVVDEPIVTEVCRDFDLRPSARGAPAPHAASAAAGEAREEGGAHAGVAPALAPEPEGAADDASRPAALDPPGQLAPPVPASPFVMLPGVGT